MGKGLAVLAWMLALQPAAFARCPPNRDAAVVAAGGAIVTGQIIAVGPETHGYGPPFAAWAHLQVQERKAGSAPDIVRLRASEAGLYTTYFAVGQTVTFLVHNPSGESGVTICEGRAR